MELLGQRKYKFKSLIACFASFSYLFFCWALYFRWYLCHLHAVDKVKDIAFALQVNLSEVKWLVQGQTVSKWLGTLRALVPLRLVLDPLSVSSLLLLSYIFWRFLRRRKRAPSERWLHLFKGCCCIYLKVKSRCACMYVCVCVFSCVWLCDPMDCSPPESSVHEIFTARILKWVAISFSKGSSWPRDRTCGSCITGRFHCTTRETRWRTYWPVIKCLSKEREKRSLQCGVGFSTVVFKF